MRIRFALRKSGVDMVGVGVWLLIGPNGGRESELVPCVEAL